MSPAMLPHPWDGHRKGVPSHAGREYALRQASQCVSGRCRRRRARCEALRPIGTATDRGRSRRNAQARDLSASNLQAHARNRHRLRGLAGINASFVHLGRDGQLLASSADYGLDDSRLRRAQALARENGLGVRLAQAILAHKLRVQTNNLLSLVVTYWKAWEKLPVHFAKAEVGKVPAHWLSFGLRHSPLTASPRLAANPANAILNYLYAIAEVECRIACFAVGLDPALGVVHADQRARDSMALDLIEAIRPAVDVFALDLLRVKISLARALTATCVVWRQHAAPVAEEAARILASESSSIDVLPTPLTQGNRSKGRDGIRKGERKLRFQASRLPRACMSCGVVFDDGQERTYCDECIDDARRSEFDRARVQATTALDALRRQGSDPAHGGDAGTKRATSLARRRAQAEAFQRMAGELPARETFIRDILPGLAAASIRAMAEATGLTRAYCSMIRRGRYVPHPRHWEALQNLAQGV